MQKIVTILLLTLSFGAGAVPVTWTLNDVRFDQGSVATGQFTYDADLDLFSNVDVVVLAGNAGYLFVTDGLPSSCSDSSAVNTFDFDCYFPNGTGGGIAMQASHGPNIEAGMYIETFLSFSFASELTNSGGTIAIKLEPWAGGLQQYGTAGPGCGLDEYPGCYIAGEDVVSGTVSAVPVPAAAWLFGSALAGLGWVRRKRS